MLDLRSSAWHKDETVIENILIKNFKILQRVGLTLRPLTIIVGPNASGKSCILQALTHVGFVYPAATWEALHSQGFEESVQMQGNGRYAGKALTFEVDIQRGKSSSDRRIKLDGSTAYLAPDDLKILLLKLEPSRLAQPSSAGRTSLSASDALPSVLADLHLEDISRFYGVVQRLKEVVPEVLDLHVRRVPDSGLSDARYELIFDMKGAKGLPAHSVGEGILLSLVLLTILSAAKPPQLILIDDLERGLHPRALKSLIREFRRIQELNPELQIIATSHSPYLLDFVEAKEVFLTSLNEDGYAVVRPLTDHPEYERWKSLMAPGEFWSTVGESWITKKDTEPAKAE